MVNASDFDSDDYGSNPYPAAKAVRTILSNLHDDNANALFSFRQALIDLIDLELGPINHYQRAWFDNRLFFAKFPTSPAAYKSRKYMWQVIEDIFNRYETRGRI